MGKLKIEEGDLLKSDADLICHQTYCTNQRSDALGLAKKIFDAEPSANVYINRDRPSDVGTIKVIGKYVALFAQYYPGPPREEHDHAINRRLWFYQALSHLELLVRPGQTVAFPELIGCDLAKGDPKEYNRILTEFAARLPKDCTTILYRWAPNAPKTGKDD